MRLIEAQKLVHKHMVGLSGVTYLAYVVYAKHAELVKINKRKKEKKTELKLTLQQQTDFIEVEKGKCSILDQRRSQRRI